MATKRTSTGFNPQNQEFTCAQGQPSGSNTFRDTRSPPCTSCNTRKQREYLPLLSDIQLSELDKKDRKALETYRNKNQHIQSRSNELQTTKGQGMTNESNTGQYLDRATKPRDHGDGWPRASGNCDNIWAYNSPETDNNAKKYSENMGGWI